MKQLRVGRFALGAFSLLLGAYALLSGAEGNYHLVKTIPLGAAPGGGEYFDYINFDAGSRRVYVSHGTEVKVLNADTGKVVGTIGGLKRCHGVAIVPEVGKGFITDGDLAQVFVFDLKTFKTISQINVSKDADYILYDAASKRIFVFAGDSKNATVIDPAKAAVISTIDLGGAPEQAVSDGKGTIYDNIQDTNEVVAIDSKTLKIKNRWPVAPAGHPVSIAMDRQHRRLFVSGRGPQMLVEMDADSGKVIGEGFPIGSRVDTNIFDPALGIVAASTADGTIHIYHEDSPDKLSPVETVKTAFGAKTMALDPKTHNLYVDTSDFKPTAPTEKQPNPLPTAIPGNFRVMIYGR
jgi:WD40 repeat protein